MEIGWICDDLSFGGCNWVEMNYLEVFFTGFEELFFPNIDGTLPKIF